MSQGDPAVGAPQDRAFGLAAFGLAAPAEVAVRGASPARVRPHADSSELRFAACVLTGALAAVYLAAGITLLGRLSATAWVLIAVGALEAVVSCAVRWRHGALPIAVLVNVLLVLSWLLSRTIGLPGLGGRPLPIGVLDSLCAADSVAVAALGWAAWRERRALDVRPRGAALNHLAILLAVLTTSALLGGHTHTGPASASAALGGHTPAYHLFCRLL